MLVLVRGVPGSGKSTWVSSQAYKDCNHCLAEADMYFIRPDGVYDFNPSIFRNQSGRD